MANILVAASGGIVCIPWMLRALRTSIQSNDIQVHQFGRNNVLNECLHTLGYKVPAPKGGRDKRRSEIRAALESIDFLLLWDGRSMSELLYEARLKGTPTKVLALEVTEVVNKDTTDDFDIYIGRGTPWGNPYPVGKQDGQYERDESIALFRQHFEKNMLTDKSLRTAYLQLFNVFRLGGFFVLRIRI